MLILASQSPRRRELLGLITEQFLVRPTGCDESFSCADPAEHARQLALRKCAAALEAEGVTDADAVIAIAIVGSGSNTLAAANVPRTMEGIARSRSTDATSAGAHRK
jgi:septum formation protein